MQKEVFRSRINFDNKLYRGRIAYDNLAGLHNQIIQANDIDINLDITTASRFGRTFLFLIPCLNYLANEHGKNIDIAVSKTIHENLGKLAFINSQLNLGSGDEMRFERLENDEKTLNLVKRIVEDMPVEMSPRLHEDMVSKIGEMFNNAHEHSNAKHVLGGRYPNRKRFCFVCYDTGVGIPEKIRSSKQLSKEELTDDRALDWALQRFNSTAPELGPRGLGLDHLREFSRLNRGVIRICTGNTLYTYDCSIEPIKESFQAVKNIFCGTLFEMDINADRRYYQYKGEV